MTAKTAGACAGALDLAAEEVPAGSEATSAVTVWFLMLFAEGRGVVLRHSAFSGVVSAHAGRLTNPRRVDQPPPTAEAKDP